MVVVPPNEGIFFDEQVFDCSFNDFCEWWYFAFINSKYYF